MLKAKVAGVVGVVIVLLLVVSVYWKSQESARIERDYAALEREGEQYKSAASEKAIEAAFELARPYLTPESRGAYGQRLKMLQESGYHLRFHGIDSSEVFLSEIVDELDRIAIERMYAAGDRGPYSRWGRPARLQGTPWLQIVRLGAALREIDVPTSYDRTYLRQYVKSVEEERASFVMAKEEAEAALFAANAK